MQLNIPVPKNLLDFERTFRTETQCRKALHKARWPNGFRCPRCQHERGWKRITRPTVVECRACHYEASLTAGTLFHGTKLPLTLLFRLVYMIVMEKDGISAMALHRQLGINYKTAELWLRKVRTAMVRPAREPLDGRVEIDETKLGGVAVGCQGRKLGPHQAWVIIYAEEKEDGFGRIRLVHAPRNDGEWIGDSVRTEVRKGSTLHTDGNHAYRHLVGEGYEHEREVIADPKLACKMFPRVHRVASLLQRWLLGTLQGSWSLHWLQSFLDEYVFRFNRRKAQYRPLLFARILETGVTRRPPTRRIMHDYARECTG